MAQAQPAHSHIGASSMERWAACPGSVKLCKDIPSTTNVYAEEGTRAHDFGAQWLKTGIKPVITDPEMADAVAGWVRLINSFQARKLSTWWIEHRFDLSKVYPGCFGTCDAAIWWPDMRKLIVPDFKYGAGIYVSPKDNPQLKYYALGALMTLQLPAETVELGIFQPRIETEQGPYRSVEIDTIDLLDFRVDLVEFAKRTEDPNAPLIPGDHCRFCPAAPTCPELHKQTQVIAQEEFRSDLTYDPAKLAKALDARDFIKAWLKNLDEFAYKEMEAGRVIPGYKLVAKRPTRQWTDEEAVRNHLKAAGYKDADMYDLSLKSPAQMEKSIGKKSEMLKPFITSISSGHTIAPESDPRPPVRASAQVDFDPFS